MILRKVQEGIVLPNIKTRYKSQQKCLVIKGMSHHSTFPLFSPGSHKKTGSRSNCNGFSPYKMCYCYYYNLQHILYTQSLYFSNSIYHFIYMGRGTVVIYHAYLKSV